VIQSRPNLKAEAWTFETKVKAKAIGLEAKAKAKAYNHTTIAEIKIRSTSDSLTG